MGKVMLSIAGLNIEVENLQFMPEALKEYSNCPSGCRSDIVLNPEQWKGTILNETGQGPEAVEFYAISAALGNILPIHKRLQTHGVAIGYEGRSYIFTAQSGTGKSTRAFIWQQYLGEDKVTVINGDKPILRFDQDEVLSCGSPWAGKEGLHQNVCMPLGGICLLRRSPDNTIRKAEEQEYFDFFVSQVQLPKDPQAMIAALDLMEELYARVPVYMLENDMSEKGFIVSYEALTGKKYR